ncbi:MAG: tRNA (guanosine(37)-N1)-methyltransferase TrmD [Clostridia bacterium]|nr:tRNA (guanosine(37)-N1)-methyltransferase TrmD [Clostridia bacterium]
MRIDIATLFPEAFAPLGVGVIGRAVESGLLEVNIVNIRDYTLDKHGKCDDTPFGGGAGMVMTPQPIHDAISVLDPDHEALRIYMSPKGRTLCQSMVKELAARDRLLFLCGSYEGIDERVLELDIDCEISIGDYVLTGGELPAMVTVNAVARYVKGVLGSEQSTDEESFSDGLLEYPQYTRPREFMGKEVPAVLLSGDHAKIAAWRRAKQIEITSQRRPDLTEGR